MIHVSKWTWVCFFFLGRIFIYLFLLLLPLSCCWRMNKTMNPNWLLIEHFCSLSFHLAYSLQTTSLNQTFPSHWQTRNRFAFWGIICYIPSRADKMITLALSLCLYRTAGAFPLVRALQLLLVVIVTISIRARKCTAKKTLRDTQSWTQSQLNFRDIRLSH